MSKTREPVNYLVSPSFIHLEMRGVVQRILMFLFSPFKALTFLCLPLFLFLFLEPLTFFSLAAVLYLQTTTTKTIRIAFLDKVELLK